MKLIKQFPIIIIVTMILSSCNFFEDHVPLFKKNSDTLLNKEIPEILPKDTATKDSVKIETIVQETEPITEPAEMSASATQFGYSNDKFYMVVGSFLTESYAQKYAEKILQMGYEPQIIQSPYQDYYRVSARSYNDYKLAVNDISSFRNNVTPRAWVHVKKK